MAHKIDLMKVPTDPWARREYLLREGVVGTLGVSAEFMRHGYSQRELFDEVLSFIEEDLDDTAHSDLESLSRVWFFPWHEAQTALQLAVSHALLGYYRAAFDHERRALEMIVVGTMFISELTTGEGAKAWMKSTAITPMFTRALEQIARGDFCRAFDLEANWVDAIKKHHRALSDICHIRGVQFGTREVQPTHLTYSGMPVPSFSSEACSRCLDSFLITMGHVCTCLAVSNPILLFGVPLEQKFGIDGPISGFFEELQAERLRMLIPAEYRDCIVRLAEADDGVRELRSHFDGLPDLTEEAFRAQVERNRHIWTSGPPAELHP